MLKEQQERRGHTFDLQVYEKEIKEAMAQANLQVWVLVTVQLGQWVWWGVYTWVCGCGNGCG